MGSITFHLWHGDAAIFECSSLSRQARLSWCAGTIKHHNHHHSIASFLCLVSRCRLNKANRHIRNAGLVGRRCSRPWLKAELLPWSTGNDHILNSTRWDYDVCESSLHGPSICTRELDRHVYKCPILQSFSGPSSSHSELRNTQTCLGVKPGRKTGAWRCTRAPAGLLHTKLLIRHWLHMIENISQSKWLGKSAHLSPWSTWKWWQDLLPWFLHQENMMIRMNRDWNLVLIEPHSCSRLTISAYLKQSLTCLPAWTRYVATAMPNDGNTSVQSLSPSPRGA